MSEYNHIPAPHQVSVEIGGRALILETGKIAKQANGAIVARYGDTVILNTACMATKPNDRDFLPLTVDYRENTYAAGKIPGVSDGLTFRVTVPPSLAPNIAV